jgi:nicotinamidase-related amidase
MKNIQQPKGPGMNTALLLLEIQNDYFPNGRTPLEKCLEASSKAQIVLSAYREKKLPVIHVQHISTQPDSVSLLPCTKGAEFYHTVAPTKNEQVVKKHYPNAFKDTQLLNYLIKNQINHLLICGMTTHMTVDATVRAARDLGFTCTVLHDACAARQLEFNHTVINTQSVHYAFLAALQPTYATVVSTDDYLQKTGARYTALEA